MTISKRAFGILCDGTPVSCWTLKGENGLTAEILDYGVIIRSVVVPDNQLSLAIGNKGQNAKLAARLTGFKIDIKPESGFFEG